MINKIKNTILIAGIVFIGVANADDLSAIKACAQIEDSLKRLVCYDQAAARLSHKKNIEKGEATVTPKVISEQESIKKTPPNPIVESVDRKEQFGIEHVQNQQKSKEKATEEKDVTYIVDSLEKSIRKRWLITFENGQVWKQSDTEYLDLSVGDTVHLSKGLFGAIYLKKDGSNRRIKVRRQK